MNLSEVRNQIISVFCEKPVFEASDMDCVKLPKEMNVRRDEIISAALSQLQETGLIKEVGEDYWMLNHPIGSSGQEIKLSMNTCNNIAETINTFLDAQGDDETPKADSLNLNEGHIITLLQILDVILMEDELGEREDDDEKGTKHD